MNHANTASSTGDGSIDLLTCASNALHMLSTVDVALIQQCCCNNDATNEKKVRT